MSKQDGDISCDAIQIRLMIGQGVRVLVPPSSTTPTTTTITTTATTTTATAAKGKGKAVPLEAWSGPEGSRKLRFPDFMTKAQDGGKVVSLMRRPPLPPGNTPGTHFCHFC